MDRPEESENFQMNSWHVM